MDILWRTGSSSVGVWHDLENYMQALVSTLIDQNAPNDLNDKRERLANEITEYLELVDGQEKPIRLTALF